MFAPYVCNATHVAQALRMDQFHHCGLALILRMSGFLNLVLNAFLFFPFCITGPWTGDTELGSRINQEDS